MDSKSPSHSNLYDTKKIRLSLTERMAILVIGDIILLSISIYFSLIAARYYHLWKLPNEPFPPIPFLWWLVIPWLIISIICDSYNSNNLRRLQQSLKQPLRITIFVGFLYTILYFFAPKDTLPRFVIVAFGIISCLLLMGWRLLHFLFCSRRSLRYKFWVVGDSSGISQVQDLVQQDKLHYEIVGELLEKNDIIQPIDNFNKSYVNNPKIQSDDTNPLTESVNNNKQENPILQSLGRVDSIILALEKKPSQHIFDCLIQCREAGIPIIPMPIFYETILKRSPVRQLQGWYMSLLPMQDAEWSGFYPIIKRLLDIFFACFGLLVLMLFFPFIALAIKSTSAGPLFFSQIRVGKHGKTFRLWKFRTMIPDAEAKGSMWTEKSDNRLTPVGGILRKLHLDELPQFWNLLKGDVSVVGVRPLSVTQCQEFQKQIPFHNLRHLVCPGITSWAVVNYKHVNDLAGAEIRLEYDLYYVKHQSLWLDILIIFRTIWTIITLNGL